MRNKTITVNMDIESMMPWQDSMLKNITGGIHPGEMVVISSGRQNGKSTYSQASQAFADWNDIMKKAPIYTLEDTALVDGVKWYTVKCNKDIASWVREHSENGWWHEHIDANWYLNKSTFDMHEKLFTLLQLKWS